MEEKRKNALEMEEKKKKEIKKNDEAQSRRAKLIF